MIFYGTNSSNLKSGTLRNVSCPHCATDSSMNYSIYSKYFYIYWIPIFPIGRTNIAECNHCKATYNLKDLNQAAQNKFQQEQDRNPTKTPIKLYSGLIIGAIITIAVIAFGIKSDADSEDFAKNPKVGDIFYETTASGKFSTSVVTKIDKDSVYVLQNNIETDKKTDVDNSCIKKENYEYQYALTRKKVIDFVKAGDSIYEIKRN
jgi:zinc-ribbon family